LLDVDLFIICCIVLEFSWGEGSIATIRHRSFINNTLLPREIKKAEEYFGKFSMVSENKIVTTE
jgi:hypothetical protein